MVRVALVISNLEFGGAQRQLVELVNASQQLDVRYFVVSMSEEISLAGQIADPGIVHIVRKRSRFDLSVVPRLARLLRELEVDIVHGFLFDAEIAVRLAGRIAGATAVIGSERNANYRIKKVQRLAYRLTHGMRAACVANSRAGAAFNARQLGYPSDHYRVVYNGVDTDRFCPSDRDTACEQLGLDAGYRWIGMVGSFKRRKNHSVFLKAARRVLDENRDVAIALAGDTLAGGLHGTDEYKREVMEEIESLDFGRRIKLVGNLEDIENFYAACDLTVLPSLHEGTPNVALESMACGTPVVASDVADNRIVIPHGDAGFIVPVNDVNAMADAISRLLNKEVLSTMQVDARAWAKKQFGTTTFARAMLDVYEDVLRRVAEAA
jgi:glycosyltransferase involved in cell wall biosynthesis